MAWNIYIDSASRAGGEGDVAVRITQGTETLTKNFHVTSASDATWLKDQIRFWVNQVQGAYDLIATVAALPPGGTFDIGTNYVTPQSVRDLLEFKNVLGTYRKLRKGYDYKVFGTQDTTIYNYYVNLGSALKGTFLQHPEFGEVLDDLGV